MLAYLDNINNRIHHGHTALHHTPVQQEEQRQHEVGVESHAVVVWLGDLNYRATSTVTMDQARSFIQNDQLDTFLSYDQLCREREEMRAFYPSVPGDIQPAIPEVFQHARASAKKKGSKDKRLEDTSVPLPPNMDFWHEGKVCLYVL